MPQKDIRYKVNRNPDVNKMYSEEQRLEHLEHDATARREELRPVLEYVNLKMETERANRDLMLRVRERVITGGVWACIVGLFVIITYAIKNYIHGG